MSYLGLIFFISQVEIPTVPKAYMTGGTVTTIVLLTSLVCHARHLKLTNFTHLLHQLHFSYKAQGGCCFRGPVLKGSI